MDCSFFDSPEGLMEKSDKQGCALCRLLSRVMLAQSKSRLDSVRFARVSSYLTIDDGKGQPVANICTLQGTYRTH
jgi:hypothetical protein